jgi:hypothetical protein
MKHAVPLLDGLEQWLSHGFKRRRFCRVPFTRASWAIRLNSLSDHAATIAPFRVEIKAVGREPSGEAPYRTACAVPLAMCG